MAYIPIIRIERQENHSIKKIKSISLFRYESMEELDDLTPENIETEYSLDGAIFWIFDSNSNLIEIISKDGYYNMLYSESFTYNKENKITKEVTENYSQFPSNSYISSISFYEYDLPKEIIYKKTFSHKYQEAYDSNIELPNSDEWKGYNISDYSTSEYYYLKEIKVIEHLDWGKREKVSIYNESGSLIEEQVCFLDKFDEFLEDEEIVLLKNNKDIKSLSELNGQRRIERCGNMEFKYDIHGNLVEKKFNEEGKLFVEYFEYDEFQNKVRQIYINDKSEEEYKFEDYYNGLQLIESLYYSHGNLFQRTIYNYDNNLNYFEKKVYTDNVLTSYHQRQIEYY
jgi:hypothetical protein